MKSRKMCFFCVPLSESPWKIEGIFAAVSFVTISAAGTNGDQRRLHNLLPWLGCSPLLPPPYTTMPGSSSSHPSVSSLIFFVTLHMFPWARDCDLSMGQLTLQLKSMAFCSASAFQPNT